MQRRELTLSFSKEWNCRNQYKWYKLGYTLFFRLCILLLRFSIKLKKYHKKLSHGSCQSDHVSLKMSTWMTKISKVIGGELLAINQSQWCIHLPTTDLISCVKAWIIWLLYRILEPIDCFLHFHFRETENVKSIQQLNKTSQILHLTA